MNITLEADYAVRIVEMLSHCTRRTDASQISTVTQVPQRFALKILRKLVSADLVKSYRGASGGYELSRPPQEITLRQVIEVIEGPFTISRCQDTDYCCTNSSCKVHQIYYEISQMVRDKLDTYTFADESDTPVCGEKSHT
jgi:Rrf2 family protein